MVSVQRTSRGKQKIEIKKIVNKISRQVTFTKRREGLFKKCSDLCSKFNSEFVVVTFSIAGKPIVSGHPSAEDVIQRFIRDSEYPNSVESENNRGSHTATTSSGVNWWDNLIDNLGLEDLERFKTALMGLRDEVVSRVHQINKSNSEGIKDVGYVDLIPEFWDEIHDDGVCVGESISASDVFGINDNGLCVDASTHGCRFSDFYGGSEYDGLRIDARNIVGQFSNAFKGTKGDGIRVDASNNGDLFSGYSYQFPDYHNVDQVQDEYQIPELFPELLPAEGRSLDFISCY